MILHCVYPLLQNWTIRKGCTQEIIYSFNTTNNLYNSSYNIIYSLNEFNNHKKIEILLIVIFLISGFEGIFQV